MTTNNRVVESGSLEALVGRVADEFTQRLNRGEEPDVEEYAGRHPEVAEVLRQVLPALVFMRLPQQPMPESGPDDPQVGLALQEYLAALEAGCPPAREEFLAKHPSIAEALGPYLDGVELMHAAAPRPGEGEPRDGTPLGDFRLLREVGRGGMGIVYEAEQLSLSRRVALKVLPFAATMDPRHLQRFHNEARAAASLHHEHIVPVYAVGSVRGVHYYAMQFIDGATLEAMPQRRGSRADEDTIDQSRQPGTADTPAPGEATRAEQSAGSAGGLADCRLVARLGIEAAEALEYAHSVGVVHRDVKPGNLMIDGTGKLWVTDFGLARLGADSSLTMTGDLVGTLRYMSPEQALAKHGLVDHRTDVYSLGATLYELLTGAPAVGGNDRQEILRRIAFEEPRPPRSVNRAIPPDLETVVLKALAKEPEGRYATAKELADDLRRFLEHRPVLARRPGLGERAWRWAWRHRRTVAGVAGLLLLAVVCLAVTLFVVTGALDRETAALGEANAKLEEANTKLTESEINLGNANTRLDQAAQERKQLEAGLRQSVASLKPVFALMGPLLEKGKYAEAEALADRVAVVCRYVADVAPGNLAERQSLLFLLGEASNRLEGMGMLEQAVATRRSSTALWKRTVADFPHETRLKLGEAFRVAEDQQKLAANLLALRQLDEAEAAFKEALDLWEQARAEFDPAAHYLCVFPEAATSADLARVYLRRGQAREAEQQCQAALTLLAGLKPDAGLPWQRQLAQGRTQHALGDVLWVLDRHDEARQAYRKAIEQLEEYLKSTKGGRADLRDELALLLADCPAAELRQPDRAVEIAKQTTESAPYNPVHWRVLGIAHHRAGDHKAAIEALTKSAQIRADRAFRANPGIRLPLHENTKSEDAFFLAMAHTQLGDKARAREWYDGGIKRRTAGHGHDADLERLRDEAAKVLGVKELAPP